MSALSRKSIQVSTILYTDGSKTSTGTGSALSKLSNQTYSWSLSTYTPILITEHYAICGMATLYQETIIVFSQRP